MRLYQSLERLSLPAVGSGRTDHQGSGLFVDTEVPQFFGQCSSFRDHLLMHERRNKL